MKKSRTQIIATIGPSSNKADMLSAMIENGTDLLRLNMSWASIEEHQEHIDLIKKVSKKLGVIIPIIIDLPGPRVELGRGHSYVSQKNFEIDKEDEEMIKFGIKNNADYFAMSFVGGSDDVIKYREKIESLKGNQKLITKIERKKAVENFEEILDESDAIMIARGDLGKEIPIEQVPFVQSGIIEKTRSKNKPVIVATEMLYSMVKSPEPTRAEVSDVSMAVLEGTDALMLSDETAIGKYPDLAVCNMEKIILESEKHEGFVLHPL